MKRSLSSPRRGVRRRLEADERPPRLPTPDEPAWRSTKSLWLILLRCYLRMFSLLAPNPSHARREHLLIEGSLVDAYDDHLGRGATPHRAGWRALREHLSELQPIAVARKTRDDAHFAPAGAYPYWTRVAAAPLGFFLVVGGAFGAWNVADSAGAAQPTTSSVALVFPAGDPRAGELVELGQFPTEREAVFAVTGGTVCLPPDASLADYSPEVRAARVLPTIAPGDTESCADLRHFDAPE